MKTKSTLIVVSMVTLGLSTTPIYAEGTIFEDTFESGDMSTTNSDGFSWDKLNRTSIVTQSEVDGNVVIFNAGDGSVYKIKNDDRDWSAFEGNNSLRFRYPEGEEWSEQAFDLGGEYPELWISYWLRVPSNFSHGTQSPNNHKLFAIWMDAYSQNGDGPTVLWEFWNNENNGSNLTVHYSEGGFTNAGGHLQSTPFISFPDDQGRWMHIVLHVTAATNDESNDGIIEMWRLWSGESSYTQFHSITDANIALPEGGPEGWAKGYLMGWANAPYSSNTEWLLDNFVVSRTTLLNVPDLPAPSPPRVNLE